MSLVDLRFLQHAQALLLRYADGGSGTIKVAMLNAHGQVLTGIEMPSPESVMLYFDGADQGVLFAGDDLKGFLQ
jgi:hypothetical protein